MNSKLTMKEWRAVLERMVQESGYVDKDSSRDIWRRIENDLTELNYDHEAMLRERVNLRLRSK
jgi:hypothetical protein